MNLKELLKSKKKKKILLDYINNSVNENKKRQCEIQIGFNKNNDLVLIKSAKIYSSTENLTESIISVMEFIIADGEILTNDIGFCSFFEVYAGKSSHLYLNLITVNDKSYLGLGYGSLMIRYIEQYALSAGVNEIFGTFLPMPPGDKTTTLKFYTKNGFDFRNTIDNPHIRIDLSGFDTNCSCTEVYKYKENFRFLMNIEYDKFRFVENIFSKKTLSEQLSK